MVLTYPYEITNDTTVALSGINIKLNELVVFACIKNGEHQSKGFAFFSKRISKFSPDNESHFSKLHGTVMEFFGVKKSNLPDIGEIHSVSSI